MKLGLKLWSTNTENYKKETQKLYEQGVYDYIELFVVPDTLETLNYWKSIDIPYVIHAPHFAFKMNLAKPECLENNMKLAKETIKFADVLGAENIIFHGGIDGTHLETSKQLKSINDNRILIENKPLIALPKMGGEKCIGSRVEEIKEIMEIAGCGFCFDIGHAIAASNSYKINYWDYINQFMELNPVIYHLSDTDTKSELDSHKNFGQGDLDIVKVFEILPENAKITIETNKKSKENLDDFVDDINFLRDLKICK